MVGIKRLIEEQGEKYGCWGCKCDYRKERAENVEDGCPCPHHRDLGFDDTSRGC